jgi:hypothetical protein
MNFDILLPMTLIVGIVYAIRTVVEARSRRQLLLAADGSLDLVNALLQAQQRQRRLSALRWGVVLVALAIGFACVEWLGWELSPGSLAVLVGATGIGNLIFHALGRRLD